MLKQNISQIPNLKINQKINPSQINSIKILQMSAIELEDYTRSEIEKNPFLISSKKYNETNDNENIDNYSENINIKEWLYQQSSFISIDKWAQKLVEVFIENITSKGFCNLSIKDAAKMTQTTEEQSKYVLNKMKLLDPEGIFSKNLEEHLIFQLKNKNIFNNHYNIIINNLNYVAAGNYKKLAELCISKESEIIKLINNVKSLKPTPIDGFKEEKIDRVIPDFIVETKNNDINFSLNNINKYEVLIDEKYINEIKIKQKNLNIKEAKVYIKNCIAHGKMLQNNLNRRNNTLILIADKIFIHQKKFFFNGEEEILPLTHKIIAEKTVMNESTISRAVKNKYVKFNNITLPMSYFFTSKTIEEKNNNNSAVSIKAKIKKIIDSELNKDIIYSDKNIVEILSKKNIKVARRTVTKYRESLNIANSLVRSKNNFIRD